MRQEFIEPLPHLQQPRERGERERDKKSIYFYTLSLFPCIYLKDVYIKMQFNSKEYNPNYIYIVYAKNNMGSLSFIVHLCRSNVINYLMYRCLDWLTKIHNVSFQSRLVPAAMAPARQCFLANSKTVPRMLLVNADLLGTASVSPSPESCIQVDIPSLSLH